MRFIATATRRFPRLRQSKCPQGETGHGLISQDGTDIVRRVPDFLPVLDAAALPPGKGETIELGGRRIAVFNIGGQFYALDDTCPHRGGPLGPGWIEGEKCTVACPLHGWEFDLKTGACLTVPSRPVRAHLVRVVEGKVEIAVQPAGGVPISDPAD